MLEKGQTPPGIRTDINDKPPDPSAAPPAARMKPRPKPWERGAAGSLASSLGGAGGSSSSLGSLPAGGAAVAGPAAADADATAAERGSPAAAALQDASPRAPPAAEPVLLQALSPVRAPSPSEQAGGAVQAAGSVGDQEAQRGAEEAPAGAVGSGSSFQSPRRAASIYDAVAPAPDSPHIIAGRLSPARPENLGRSSSSSSVGGGVAQPASASLEASAGGSSSFAAVLAAAQERAASARSSMDGPLIPAPLEGSGIGRPISRNWRPPPIPAPTLSGSASGGISASSGGGAAVPGGIGISAAPAPEAGSGTENDGPRSPSAASLGQDFASA